MKIVSPFAKPRYPIQPKHIVVSRWINKYINETTTEFLMDFIWGAAESILKLAKEKNSSWEPITELEASRFDAHRNSCKRKKYFLPKNYDYHNPGLTFLTKDGLAHKQMLVKINGHFWFTHHFVVNAFMASHAFFSKRLNEKNKANLYPVRPSHIETGADWKPTHPIYSPNPTLAWNSRLIINVCQKKKGWKSITREELEKVNIDLSDNPNFFEESCVRYGYLKQTSQNRFSPTPKLVCHAFLANPKGNFFFYEDRIREKALI